MWLYFIKEQLHNVLDAMEERKVVADEVVIQQGDDGDNFYIIERYLWALKIFESKSEKGENLNFGVTKFKWPYLRLHNTYALCFWYGDRYFRYLLLYQKQRA